jgi:hypothetical protein
VYSEERSRACDWRGDGEPGNGPRGMMIDKRLDISAETAGLPSRTCIYCAPLTRASRLLKSSSHGMNGDHKIYSMHESGTRKPQINAAEV